MTRFDTLVLGGGGVLGEAWMTSLLAGLERAEGFDGRDCERYVGTSAGSIVAAHLVAGESPGARLGELPDDAGAEELARSGEAVVGQLVRIAGALASPLAAALLRASAGGGALARRLVLRRVAPGRRSHAELRRAIERTGARFDGRLMVSAVSVDSGRRVMFGTGGAPSAAVADAVAASCAIPGVFQPVVIRGRSYVDGGVWSPTNMDVVEGARRVLCLNPTGSLARFGPLAAISRSVAAAEALVLRRRGATVVTVTPDARSVRAIGPNLMDPGRREGVVSAGLAQGLSLGG